MSDEAPEYHSPKRCLARSFRLSRDRWKLKATERLVALRCSRVRIRDLAASRDLWKRKALYYEQVLRDNGLPPAPAPAAARPAGGPGQPADPEPAPAHDPPAPRPEKKGPNRRPR